MTILKFSFFTQFSKIENLQNLLRSPLYCTSQHNTRAIGQHPTQNPKTTFKNSNDWQRNRSLQRHGEARILHTREEALILDFGTKNVLLLA